MSGRSSTRRSCTWCHFEWAAVRDSRSSQRSRCRSRLCPPRSAPKVSAWWPIATSSPPTGTTHLPLPSSRCSTTRRGVRRSAQKDAAWWKSAIRGRRSPATSNAAWSTPQGEKNVASSAPTVVLLCHDDDPLDREGLARWLACTFRLAGMVLITDTPRRKRRALARERKRSGWLGLADALAFHVHYQLTRGRADRAWATTLVERLAERYQADLGGVARITTANPNDDSTRNFLAALAPDLVIARC